MNKTVIAIAAVIILLVAGMAVLKVGIFAEREAVPQDVPAEAAPLQDDSVSSIESELDSIDIGSDLEADFQATDQDIQSL